MNAKGLLQSFVTIALLLAALFPIPGNAAPAVLYVKPRGLISGACDSWANACDLQYALTSAVAGQEIWVAAGVYKPGTARTVYYAAQVSTGPPTFMLFANRTLPIRHTYRRYLENRLRADLGLAGVPLRLVVRSRLPRA